MFVCRPSMEISSTHNIIAHNNDIIIAQHHDSRRPFPDFIMAETSIKSKSCGSLHCQRDSYARSLSSVVVSCEPSPAKEHEGKYELLLEDTVLFPEGGGQVYIKLNFYRKSLQDLVFDYRS